jgi:hypothetical protein
MHKSVGEAPMLSIAWHHVATCPGDHSSLPAAMVRVAFRRRYRVSKRRDRNLPPMVWAVLGVFVGFAAVWNYFRVMLSIRRVVD